MKTESWWRRTFHPVHVSDGFLLTLVATLSACSDASTADTQAARTSEEEAALGQWIPRVGVLIGGSNYAMFSVGTYKNTGSDADWWAAGNLKPVVAAYHENPALVRSQLQNMFVNGQRKIALPIWFTDRSGVGCGDWRGHVIDSSHGDFPPTQKNNLKELLQDISAAGFNEVVIRFMAQGVSDPASWTSWSESRFQQNWNLIYNTHEWVKSAGVSVPVVYDIGGELGGVTSGEGSAYTDKLWRNYVSRFGTSDTWGFSIIGGSHRLERQIRRYQEAGATPSKYPLDIYEHAHKFLKEAHDDLTSTCEQFKQVVILETFYNDAHTRDEFRRATDVLGAYGFSVYALFQWPLTSTSTIKHFDMDFPSAFGEYIESYIERREPSECDPRARVYR